MSNESASAVTKDYNIDSKTKRMVNYYQRKRNEVLEIFERNGLLKE